MNDIVLSSPSKMTLTPDTVEADYYLHGSDIRNDFVLCRNKNGEATATYGDNVWNFTPYATLGTSTKLDFNSFAPIESLNNDDVIDLINTTKKVLFFLLYKVETGRTGQIMLSTFVSFYYQLLSICKFCLEQNNNNKFLSTLNLVDFFESNQWIGLYIKTNIHAPHRVETLLTIVSHLKKLPYEVSNINLNNINISKPTNIDRDTAQHPVIPSSIYIGIMNKVFDEVSFIYEYRTALLKFISRLDNKNMGRTKETQKSNGVISEHGCYLPTFDELIKNKKIKTLFLKHEVSSIGDFTKFLHRVQALIKIGVHFFTGMRDKEATRLPYNCIATSHFKRKNSKGDDIVSIISTTTKFTGYEKEAAWLAPKALIKIIEIGKAINDGIVAACGFSAEDNKLFISPTNLQSPNSTEAPSITIFKKHHSNYWADGFKISVNDQNELRASDSGSLITLEKYQVGKDWNFTSHQFRRSLAFYGANSKLISLTNVKRQYKHACLEMARYYTNNHEEILTIFGVYDDRSKKYNIPNDHIINEFQTGIPLATATKLVEDILCSDETLFGKKGGYIEKIRENLSGDNDVYIIEEIKNDTAKRVATGEIKYTETLLGGCMTLSPCDNYMLGEVTACLSCDDSSIKESKLNEQIDDVKSTLNNFNEDTGEHQILSFELKQLEDYKKHRIERDI